MCKYVPVTTPPPNRNHVAAQIEPRRVAPSFKNVSGSDPIYQVLVDCFSIIMFDLPRVTLFVVEIMTTCYYFSVCSYADESIFWSIRVRLNKTLILWFPHGNTKLIQNTQTVQMYKCHEHFPYKAQTNQKTRAETHCCTWNISSLSTSQNLAVAVIN